MFRRITTIASGLILLCAFSAFAQEGVYDYFTVDQTGVAEYLRILESAHMNQRVYSLVASGLYNYAIPDIKYTLDRFPNHPQGLQLMGTVARLTKNPSMAVLYFEKAVNLYPQYALTQAQYGFYLVDINHVDVGIDRLNRATKLDPKLSMAYAGLARAYAKKGDTDRAREAANRARELGYTGALGGSTGG